MAGNQGPKARSQNSEDRSKDAPHPIHGHSNEEMTPYTKERQEAQMHTIHDSMERAVGRSGTPLDGPCAMGEYDPHDWIRW